ncbi:hypothetical protein JCM10212_001217 [Sporobolomyces blumeae]
MSSHLRETFARREASNEPTFVTFLTAGFPSIDATVPVLLAMERGGADVFELGVPFSDPLADGKAIQEANTIALKQGVDYARCLTFVREARERGLEAPVILMGYVNPLFAYGVGRAITDAKAAGANGFIVVDLPPEEAVEFRQVCREEGMSYVPLVAPSTSNDRIQFLSSIADSFLHVVSRMGTTGATDNVEALLSRQLAPVRSHLIRPHPLAVGFGVLTQAHFKEVGRDADGVVIGSQLVAVIKEASKLGTEACALAVEAYCASVSGNRTRKAPLPKRKVSDADKAQPIVEEKAAKAARFGDFGGAYVPEALYDCLEELTTAYADARADPAFWKEWENEFGYMNRPSQLYKATRLSEHCGGANIWFKREDLNHTGSHKINNAIGQILLACRIGKKRIIAETGAGQHGFATATVCAKFGLECNVYMDAINKAMRDLVTNLLTTYYLVGLPIGPAPLPTIVRDFQLIIGDELRTQSMTLRGSLPDAVVACMGGGSSAIGSFSTFIDDASVRLVGVEAAGKGLETPSYAAILAYGTPGIINGARTLVLQTGAGQIRPKRSIAAGLDYPAVGPELASIHKRGRMDCRSVSDEQALEAFHACARTEGIIPLLEASHAVLAAMQLSKELSRNANIIVMDPKKVSLAYTPDSIWRNRDQFFQGRDAIEAFLTKKWQNETKYRLKKRLFAFTGNRIAVQFWYEYFNQAESSWKRTYGLEHWTFAQDGLMQKRQMSGNEISIEEEERWFRDGVDVDDVEIPERDG